MFNGPTTGLCRTPGFSPEASRVFPSLLTGPTHGLREARRMVTRPLARRETRAAERPERGRSGTTAVRPAILRCIGRGTRVLSYSRALQWAGHANRPRAR